MNRRLDLPRAPRIATVPRHERDGATVRRHDRYVPPPKPAAPRPPKPPKQ